MTQEFHLSVTPIRDNEYLVRTEDFAPGVPLAEEQVTWAVDDWLTEASLLMGDPVMGLLRNPGGNGAIGPSFSNPQAASPSGNLINFGQRLFNALFQGTIRDSWMMARGIAQHQHHRLRFRLGLKGEQLHRLPWEVLYAGDRPLAAGTDIIFSRYHSSFAVRKSHVMPPKLPLDGPQPLKILLVLAAPTDQEGLALKQEAEQLRQELRTDAEGPGSALPAIELTILEQPGREQLTQALEHNHFQVLHYAGHSDLGTAGGSLHLVNRQTGLTEIMTGDDLAGLLVNNGVRMAVFNSCRGVYTATLTNGQTTEGNLAESLVRRGIPAVLAMAEQIPDNVALNLSRLFYRNLKQAYPLDLSLSRTRQGLISSYGSDRLYWALPVLYLHPEFDGFLLPAPAESAGVVQSSSPYASDFYSSPDLLSFTLDEALVGEIPGSPAIASQQSEPVPDARSLQPADQLEFDALEFDDPEPPEEEHVARLIHEVSHSPTVLEPEEAMLPASPDENLLPRRWQPNGHRPQASRKQPDAPTIYPPQPPLDLLDQWTEPTPPPVASSPSPATVIPDVGVYSELEAVLQTMGTLTPAIAASNRAVRDNPASAEAYTSLGWELYQQGYLTEAVAAYNQAIRLNPKYADAFSRLGLAFLQQGKVDAAVRAYQQAVKLDPTMTEASTNLRNALTDHDHPQAAISPPPKVPASKSPRVPPRPSRWLWVCGSLGAIAVMGAIAGWVYRDTWSRWIAPPPPPTQAASPPASPTLDQLPPAALTDLGLKQLQQKQIQAAEATITALLDKTGNLDAAAKVLQSVPPEFIDQPAIAFLRSRLIWQKWVAGDKSADLESARQLLNKSLQAAPTAQKQNMLGFIYYAQGKTDLAQESWYAALRAAGGKTSPTPTMGTAPLNPDALTAFAGLAIAAAKLADMQPTPDQQAALRAAAIDRRQTVLNGDRDGAFRPDALSKSWLWSETAINDWQKLGQSPG